MTQIKYTNEDDEQAQELLTWSVINLSRIPQLVEDFDDFFGYMIELYEQRPQLLNAFAKSVFRTEEYGTGTENMFDLAGIFYDQILKNIATEDIRWQMQRDLSDAVDYCLRGPGRPAARGISFCFAADFDVNELETYSHNCPSPNYLALLDAITPWTAPARVYEQAKRPTSWDSMEEYHVTAGKRMMENGTPALVLSGENQERVGDVRFNVYRQIDTSKEIVTLGNAPAYPVYTESGDAIYIVDNPVWPAIEGQHCEIEVVSGVGDGDFNFLFNVPIMIGTDVWYLRCGYFDRTESYVVFGIWEGFDSDSNLFSRNVAALSQMSGQDYQLLFPVYSGIFGESDHYEAGPSQQLYRSLEMKDKPLDPGTYFIQYVVYDPFLRPMPMDMIEIHWDGDTLTLADGITWEGETELSISRDYWKLNDAQ